MNIMIKKILVLSMGLILPFLLVGQIRVEPQDAVRTGILYDLSVPLSGISHYDGSADAAVNSAKNWYQVLFELSKATVSGQHLPVPKSVRTLARHIHDRGIIPIGLIRCRYNRLERKIRPPVENGILDLANTALSENKVFTAAALIEKTYRGNSVCFMLDESLMFSNDKSTPSVYRISFGADLPFANIEPGTVIEHSFEETGLKTIRLQALMPDGRVLHSAFYFDVAALVTPPPTATWAVQSDIPYLGQTTTGDGFVLLADSHQQIEMPVVICEGIDFEDNLGWDALYNMFNQQNLLEDLRSQGFDAVVLNFHEPLTYIQRNAMLMAKLIQMVNDSMTTGRQLIVVGPSMGGMVTRYALTWMENQGLNHNTGLYISFDAPHRGANMPLGLQYEINFFKDLDASVQMLLDILNSPAPRQMLAYHYTDPPTATAEPDPLFAELQTDYQTIGNYPQNLRKIALSNGRGDGTGQPYSAGAQVIQYEYSSFLATIKGNVWAVEDQASGQIFEGLINSFLYPNQQQNVTVYSEKPYDNAPGGSRSTFADLDTLSVPIGDIVALHDNHCFIPTVSALDIDEENLFHNLAVDPNIMQKTPFDSIYWSADNYDHTFISPATAAVVISEMMQTLTRKQTVPLHAGWNDLSAYIDPNNPDVQDLTAPLGDNLVILQHFSEVYWPDGGINSIGNWDAKKGYFIKTGSSDSLVFEGDITADRTVQVKTGWNLVPVLSEAPVDIVTLLGANINKTIIIREAIGMGVFWPDMGVSNITELVPGRAYYLKATESFVLGFE